VLSEREMSVESNIGKENFSINLIN
jgi:hypothetical protein